MRVKPHRIPENADHDITCSSPVTAAVCDQIGLRIIVNIGYNERLAIGGTVVIVIASRNIVEDFQRIDIQIADAVERNVERIIAVSVAVMDPFLKGIVVLVNGSEFIQTFSAFLECISAEAGANCMFCLV